jgi:alcohol dehydrogenase YqhD (iron-dependent ADH family)
MSDFTFHNPTKIIFGKNTIEQIGNILKEYNYRKILLIAGSGSIKKNGVYETVSKSLKESNIKFTEIWNVRANPILSKTNEAIALAKENKAEAILTVGGGSVIDTGKSVAAGFFTKNVWDFYEHKATIKNALPIFTILTISAAGSEMNCAAVLTNEAKKKKWAIVNPLLYPVVSIIDPSIQCSLPWNQTVNGALDALTHVMEYYFLGINEETTLALDESLMKTIIKETDKLKENEDDYNARSNLSWAATLALNGISGAGLSHGDWSSHEIEHSLSALYPNLAHGAGLGIVFPAWILYVQDMNPETFKRWAKNIWQADSVGEAVKRMKQKISDWESPTSLLEIGIREEEFSKIIENLMQVTAIGKLKKLGKKDFQEILKLAL